MNSYTFTESSMEPPPLSEAIGGSLGVTPGIGPQEMAWIDQFGTLGPIGDGVNGMAVSEGNVYVVGYTESVLPGQSSAGRIDVFVRRYDAGGNEMWTRQFGTSFDDRMVGAVADSSGVYVAGYVPRALPGQTWLGSYDAFVRKYDVNGNEVWTRQFGSSSIEYTGGITMDSSGIYVTGSTYGAFPGQVNLGDYDIFVCKYDFGGNALWTREFGTVSQDIGLSISAYTGVYVAGRTNGAFPGKVPAGSFDAFVRKYDVNGNEMWTQQFGTYDYDEGRGIVAGPTGVYLLGSTYAPLPGQTHLGDQDEFLRKYDDAGTEIWTRQYGTSVWDGISMWYIPGQGNGGGIAADSAMVYVGGGTTGSLSGPNLGGTDAYVRAYDFSGNEQWTLQYGTNRDDTMAGLALEATGFLVAGITRGVFPSQPGPGGSMDGYVRKYDVTRNDVWTRQIGSALVPRTESLVGATVDPEGNVYVAGSTAGILPSQEYQGGTDAFIRKYDVHGREMWTRQFGTGETDQAWGVSANALGLFVVGWTYGALPGQTSAGWADAYIRWYDYDGNEIWTRQFGVWDYQDARDVAVDSTGIYVCGRIYGAWPGQTSAGWDDAYVRKYDFKGNELWTRQFGTGDSDSAHRLAATGTAVYVVGSVYGALPGQTQIGGRDAYVRAYDPDGVELWTRQFGTTSWEEASAIALDSSGLYVAGSTYGVFPGQTRIGSSDVYVQKYDFTGGELWTRQFGTTASDSIGILTSDSTPGYEGVYLAGTTSGTFPGQTRAGGTDVFIVMLDPAGNNVWTSQFGTPLNDNAVGLAVTFTDVYVNGATAGAFPGKTNTGLNDAYVMKFALTPHEKFQLLTNHVLDLVSSEVLNEGQGNSLLVKLKAAYHQFLRGNTNAAANILGAFKNHARALMNAKILSPTEGQLLMGWASNIADHIDSGGP